MKVVSNEECYEVSGGAFFSSKIISIIAGVGVFLAGVLDGWLRPLACRK